ncbi:Acyl transferase domain-containing protein [Solimonas aquatica]|uniref:Acyl transferase domain-containing protein n=1 Tax=Solimonas aquatica TaxID=489703 RepID=A0A1H9CXZ5_9GAMM|nr:type I polyketide synthase [Solimonas aquatica]SEQ05463.1 Acyl transferase domain-containing protein [Solimonas aquatica]
MRIAIIGLACLFPGAANLRRFWQNIVEGVDAIGEVPAERIDPSYFDPASSAIDRFYCKRGGFVDRDALFDPLAFGIMPKATEAAEPDQLLMLKIGQQALQDAGYAERPFPRGRTGVIIGRGNYVSAGVLRLEQHVRLLPQLMQTLRDLFPELGERELDSVRERLQQQLSYYGPDVAAGLIPNLLASRLANRLDLHGPAYTLDAACASSLIAVEQGCAALMRRETDLMLVGGAHLSHDLTFWATFCQLGALSRRGRIAPLSADADGILAGEGVGMAVLKRLDDALADGDRVYAVIDGAASSSDGRGASLVAPSAEGQRIALEKAWSRLPFRRNEIGLLEAHGTGTPTGDGVELKTVAEFFGPHEGEGERPVIGSVKSMIGHAMPASGMASLIKAALSIYHGRLPPTLHCENPHPQLAQTRFRVIGRTEDWAQPREQRIAAVNAFGFGGINAHLVLRGLPEKRRAAPALPPVLMLSADTPEQLLARFDRGERDLRAGSAPCRLLVIEPNEKKLAMARKAIVAGKPWPGRQQIWFTPRGLLREGGKLAFVFPGVDSSFAPRGDGLAEYFGRPLPAHCETLDPAQSLMKVVLGLLGFNRYLFDCLRELGIQPQAFAGHSIGEWSAMLCSGMMDQALSDRTNAGLDLDAMHFPDVRFLAAACDLPRLQAAIDGLPQIAVSHDNCPHQVIACGVQASVEIAAARLREQAVMTQTLPIVSGFHSPLFAGHMDWYREFFGRAELLEPAVPVWSATIAAPFPAEQDAKRALALAHLLEPVRFRELVENLYADGVRVFVQLGTGSLPGFIDDSLSGRPHLAIGANHESRSGLAQLQQLCAALWVEGAQLDLRLLESGAGEALEETELPLTPSTRRLQLGVGLLRVNEPLKLPASVPAAASAPTPAANDPLGQLVQQTLADIEAAGREVLAAWQAHRSGRAPQNTPVRAATPRRLSQRVQRLLDLDRSIPYVRDHELYPQREHWPIVADRHPVVPMTMEAMLVREAVEEALPGLKVTELSHIQAYNWLAVAQPLTVQISLESLSEDCVETEILGYFKARVHVAADYPPAQLPAAPALTQPRATAVAAENLYRERWMFHGPAYQGVQAFEAIGDNGIDGVLRVPEGKGALLDNMGQLAGYWVMEQPSDCLAMPIGVDRIRFFAEDPAPGETLRAQVRIAQLDALNCVSDHRLYDAQGRLRIAIDGWRTRRYQMDKAFWVASRLLNELEAGQRVPPDVMLFEDRYDTAILRDYISRRYLTAAEREVYDALSPKRRRQWLAGRVAAKDAVRAYLREQRGQAGVFPQEMRIENDANGAPRIVPNVTDSVPDDLQLSLTHKDGLAAAIVGVQAVGIDLERVEARDEHFLDFVFSAPERALLENGEDPALAQTRGWVAKEVAAKLAGTGLGGRLRDFVIEARDGSCLCVNGHWVVTHPLREYVIGWSLGPRIGGQPALLSVAGTRH